ncbi:MAG: thioredoxin family protein [Paludibacteraceae bacterium]|nr:thioredoxin family protein [Paludibacteraceae bacterium]
MTLRRLYLLCIAVMLTGFVGAQIYEPIKWTVDYRPQSDTAGSIQFTAAIEADWHLYATSLPAGGPRPTSVNFTLLDGVEQRGAMSVSPSPVSRYDEMFDMTLSWHETRVVLSVPVRKSAGKDAHVAGYVNYMACNDKVCLSPTDYDFSLTLEAADLRDEAPVSGKASADQAVKQQPEPDRQLADREDADSIGLRQEETQHPAADDGQQSAQPAGDTDGNLPDTWAPVVEQLRVMEQSSSTGGADLWWVLLMGMLGGLIALLTPCVWPVIPMTVSFFMHRSEDTRRGRRDAILYGVSITLIYVGFSLLITIPFGADALNRLATSAVFNLLCFVLLVLFALSFFGLFEITLPGSWTTRLDKKADSSRGIWSILLMALTLVIVSFSCTGPIVGTLLVDAATHQSLAAPIVGMLGFGLALGIPFGLFAFFPTMLQQLPRSGGWMNTVKVSLAFVELAFALKFFSVADMAYGWHLLPRRLFLLLWMLLAVLLALYLFGIIRMPHDDRRQKIGPVRIGLGVVAVAFAVWMSTGLFGAPLKAVSAFAPPMSTQDNMKDIAVVPLYDYDEAMQRASEKQLPVVVDFTGYGCVNCRKMEAAVWTDSRVREVLSENVVLVSLYVDDRTSLDRPVSVMENGTVTTLRTVGQKWSYLQRHKFGTNAQPYYVMLDARGNLLQSPYGFDDDAEHFLQWLNSVR